MESMKISPAASKAWDIAANEAAQSKSPSIEKEHLLIGILSLDKALELPNLDPVAVEVIKLEHDAIENVLESVCSRKAPGRSLRRRIREALGDGGYDHEGEVVHRSEECKKLFERASVLSAISGEVSCLHLLEAILEDPGPVIVAALKAECMGTSDLTEPVMAWITIMEGSKKNINASMDRRKELHRKVDAWLAPHDARHIKAPEARSFLDRYGRDLTEEARRGNLGPFEGRKKELLQIIQILGRHTKSNPVLVGEAGVGKTAIVEALAMRIAQGKDKHALAGIRIIQLNLASILANTRYRGDMEERLNGIIDEAQADPDVILFIDEIHNIVGAGRSEGSAMDASNILKPHLARGLRCIGATTLAEYRRFIESDPALERRFEKVVVEEPSRDSALAMIKAIRPRLEEHHDVAILDEALEAAVDLSIRFDTDHQLPDKAVSLLDTACAGARIPSLSMGPMDQAKKEVDERLIAEVISEKTGIPLEVISSNMEGVTRSRLLQLEPFLRKRLVGQDEAIERVCQRLIVAYAGLERSSGPLAVFLFMGPTGVGKTEMARLIAEFLFGEPSDMIRLDMSEYAEENSVAMLLGSPPGYVGCEEEGRLVSSLRARPYSVVLFDEVEKAHSKVFDVFLQLFEEGRVTDARGRTADASNAIFIMTSNVEPDVGLSYSDVERGVMNKKPSGTKKPGLEIFRPELLNRVDELIAFKQLDQDDMRQLLRRALDEALDGLKRKHHVDLRISEDAERFLTGAGYSPDCGARELQRAVRAFVYAPLSALILKGEIKEHERWLAVYENGSISIVPDD